MPRSYSVAEARSKLPAIIDQAEAGLEVELTRRGKPVAVVVSIRKFERLNGGAPTFSEAYKNFLKKHSLAEIGVDPDFFRSLREKGGGREVRL